MTRRSPRDCMGMYVKTAIVLGAFAAFYVLLVFVSTAWWQAIPLAIGLGLAVAAIGFNVQHDGGHKAYSRRDWVNRLMAMWLDVIGASSLIWARKHNSLHHTYTNLEGHDDDLDVGFWARLSPRQDRHWFHRLQHIYLWGLYTVLVPKWQFVDDFKDLLRGKVGSHRLQRPRGWDLVQFIGGKVVFLFIAFVLPSLYHPIGIVLLLYFVAAATTGFVLSVVFQLAHVVEEAQFPQPDPSNGRVSTPWAIHQLQTTVDFARRNRALSWFIGGLNFQVEHHLFPRICHLHYPKISRIVEKACRNAGIRYYAFPTLSSAIRSHYRWLKRMGPGPEAGTGVAGADAAA
ncbi:MAG: fatty acid desaturase family protein [Planctomycetota bacterium]